MHGLRAALSEAFDELGGGDRGAFFFGIADEVDLRDDDDVGGTEADGELVEEVSGAGVLVGLEDADESPGRFVVAEGAEGGVDFGGVVSVVVDDTESPAGGELPGADALHASVEAGEMFEGVGDVGPGGAELMREDAGGGGVVGHVFTGHGGVPAGDVLAAVSEDAQRLVLAG